MTTAGSSPGPRTGSERAGRAAAGGEHVRDPHPGERSRDAAAQPPPSWRTGLWTKEFDQTNAKTGNKPGWRAFWPAMGRTAAQASPRASTRASTPSAARSKPQDPLRRRFRTRPPYRTDGGHVLGCRRLLQRNVPHAQRRPAIPLVCADGRQHRRLAGRKRVRGSRKPCALKPRRRSLFRRGTSPLRPLQRPITWLRRHDHQMPGATSGPRSRTTSSRPTFPTPQRTSPPLNSSTTLTRPPESTASPTGSRNPA